MNRLLEIGFVQAGSWSLVDGKLELSILVHGEQRNVLYSFLEDGEIRYIGKSVRTLRQRMYGYWRPSSTQSTNVRINAKIIESLSTGRSIEILVLPDSGLMHYGQFHLNLAAGLEDSLIAKIQPPWNGGEKAEPVETEPPVPVIGTFEFVLQPTYYDRGFFNVPVAASDLLGDDGQTVDVFCDDSEVPIKALVNRRLNGNNTPRIFGGAELRNWFQSHNRMTPISVDVYSPLAIRMRCQTHSGTAE